MEEYMGIIKLFAGNFAPQGWFFCNGQVLPISQYTALFSLLGTTYGGDGNTTFGLPDLRSRVPVGTGSGSPFPEIQLGQMAGETSHTLIQTEIPAHTHMQMGSTAQADQTTPSNASVIAAPGTLSGRSFTPTLGFVNSTPNTQLSPAAIAPTGGSQPHNNMQPYLGLNYIICWQGIYPSRP